MDLCRDLDEYFVLNFERKKSSAFERLIGSRKKNKCCLFVLFFICLAPHDGAVDAPLYKFIVGLQ